MRDNAVYYGSVTRFLHWVMALLFAWQFAGMVLKEAMGRTPLVKFWQGTHGSVGMLILAFIILRIIWALLQMNNRPPYLEGTLGSLAKIGHILLYALMLIIPSIALLRAFGGEYGVAFFGWQIQAPGGEKVPWMMAPANLLHGKLAWVLLALIIGHIVMVGVHKFFRNENLMPRIFGKQSA